jgi:hypothetical protein
MPIRLNTNLLSERLRARLRGLFGQTNPGRDAPAGRLPAGRLPAAPYPDYVVCPHCGEPEVEVWCYQATARCHNCAQAFEHPFPPGCAPGCKICNGAPAP